jgi:hypothetical protein
MGHKPLPIKVTLEINDEKEMKIFVLEQKNFKLEKELKDKEVYMQ